MRYAVLVAALALLGGPARAQTVPEFETLRWCFDRVPLGSTDVNGVDACVLNEERDGEAIQATYAAVPAGVRMECEAYAVRVSNGWGSYNLLGACLGEKLRPKHRRGS